MFLSLTQLNKSQYLINTIMKLFNLFNATVYQLKIIFTQSYKTMAELLLSNQ